jgi:putative membrane protein, TIGR04086 family/integral membrane protein, TIGR04097 family
MKGTRHLKDNPVFGAVRAIVIGSVAGAAFCAALLGIFALAFVTSGHIPQGFITPLVIGISALSSFIAGMVSAKISRRRGLAFGALSGLLLFILFLISGLIATHEAVSAASATRMLVMLVSGALGGLLGVSKKSKRK